MSSQETEPIPVLYPRVAKYFNDAFQKWWNAEYKRTKKAPSQADFARFLGVKAPSLNQWMNGWRSPDDKRKALVAAKLGPGIYEVTDSPALMPDDPQLRKVVEYFFELDEKTREDYLERMRKDAERNTANDVAPAA
jgi:transcriptional regulator with XRE-family HTH domain